MFKKNKIIPNTYDRQLKQLLVEWQENRDLLIGQVNILITKKNVIDLYPEGADKNKAIEDFKARQRFLLNYIARYDDTYNQLMTFDYSKCAETISAKWQYEKATSHNIIEIAYNNFYRNK